MRGALSSLAAATPTRLSQTVNLHLVAGRGAAAMADGELLIDASTARADHLKVGATVPVRFAQTGATRLRIGGIFTPNPLVGSFIVGDGFFASHFRDPLPTGVLLRTAPGTPSLNGQLNRVLTPYANVSAKTRAQFEADQKHAVNQELGLVYVLLALAVVVALIGIVNTLMLSVFERTREIGLMRAVGMKRRQVRSMIRAESVIVALFGAVVGIVIGTGLGIAAALSLRDNGVASLAVPVASLIGFLILSALLGLGAATWPARRAARLDVLAAIAVE
jgi:putative ABC transport system permease protein